MTGVTCCHRPSGPSLPSFFSEIRCFVFKNLSSRGLIPDAYGRCSLTRIEPCVFMEDNLLHVMSKLLHVMLSLKFLLYCKKHSANNEHRDQRMGQVVAYKRLKQSNNLQAQKVVAVA